eukprot:COSAG02_NODE_16022_length_1120_cov_1.409403_1_plen_213_part_10
MQAAAAPDSASKDGQRVQRGRQRRPRGCPWPSRSCPARWPCGYYGIVVVFLCALVKTHRSFGVSRIFAFTVPGIMADSSLPESHFSAIYGGATLAGAALQFKWGRLIDRYGSRVALPCFILMLGLGLTAITICGAHLGSANYPLLFVGFTAIRTTAIGALDNVTSTTVAQWFDKRRGRAMTGMIFTQELLTSSLYAQLAQHFTASMGWRWTNR